MDRSISPAPCAEATVCWPVCEHAWSELEMRMCAHADPRTEARDSLIEHLLERIPSLVFQVRWARGRQFEFSYFSDSDSAREILGVDAATAIAEPHRVWSSLADHQRARLLRAASRARRFNTVLHIQVPLLRQGEPRCIEIHAARDDASGDDALWSGYVCDVTVHSQYRLAVEAAHRAESADRAKTELLARVAHELRTPLNAVLGFARLLRCDETGRITQRQSDQLAHIEHSAQHLNSLIGDLLDLARIEAGTIALATRAVCLQHVVREVTQMLEPAAADACVRLSVAANDSCITWVWADELRVRQILLNLVSNAIKYNRPGGEVRIAWTLQASPARIGVSVSDDGFGLTSDQVSRLFTPFDRLGQHSNIDGTGIGLVITKRLVELMAGRLTVSTMPGCGSTFMVELPQASFS